MKHRLASILAAGLASVASGEPAETTQDAQVTYSFELSIPPQLRDRHLSLCLTAYEEDKGDGRFRQPILWNAPISHRGDLLIAEVTSETRIPDQIEVGLAPWFRQAGLPYESEELEQLHANWSEITKNWSIDPIVTFHRVVGTSTFRCDEAFAHPGVSISGTVRPRSGSGTTTEVYSTTSIDIAHTTGPTFTLHGLQQGMDALVAVSPRRAPNAHFENQLGIRWIDGEHLKGPIELGEIVYPDWLDAQSFHKWSIRYWLPNIPHGHTPAHGDEWNEAGQLGVPAFAIVSLDGSQILLSRLWKPVPADDNGDPITSTTVAPILLGDWYILPLQLHLDELANNNLRRFFDQFRLGDDVTSWDFLTHLRQDPDAPERLGWPISQAEEGGTEEQPIEIPTVSTEQVDAMAELIRSRRNNDAAPEPAPPKEVFPGVLLDEHTKTIELPGKIPIINNPADGTVVFLEQLVCTPDTKEHEVLVVVQAKPSHVHAALLLLGLEPGKPAEWKLEGDKLVPVHPTGPELEIEFIYKDEHGAEHTATPSDWVINFKNRDEHLPQRFPVFAGSAMRKMSNNRERYYADSEGTLIGLATFGTEVIAWPDVFSHESSQHEPEWIASPDMPPLDTPVTVRVRVHQNNEPPIAEPEEPQ